MTENSSEVKDDITTAESRQTNDFDLLKKTITYVKENVGAFTFLTTTAIAVGGVILKVIAYLIEYGKTIYFNVSSLLIDVSGNNILYDLFVRGVIALLFILLNFILSFLWSGESKMRIKIGCSFSFVLFPDLVLVFCLVIDILHGIKISNLEIVIYLLIGFLLGCTLFFWGIYDGICKYRFKIKQKNDPKKEIKKEATEKSEKESEKKTKKESRLKFFKKSLLIFLFLLVIESLLFIFIGYNIAYTQNKFKILNSGDDTYYAVIYENSNRYVITECKIENGYISFPKLDIQQEIDRDDVEYQWQRLTQKR